MDWMPQLMHFNGRRDHSKSAQQIINIVFLSFNPLWYLAFKVFWFLFFFFAISA